MKRLQRFTAACTLISAVGIFAAVTASPRTNVQSAMSSPQREQQTQSSEIDELLRSAFDLYRKGQYEEALANLNKAAALSPQDFRPLVLSAYVYSAQAKMKSASEAFAAAIRLQPRRKELYLAKAQADFLRNAHEEALETCRKATVIDPNYAEAYAMIGELLMYDDKRRPEAISALRSAIKINPTLAKPYDALGRLLEFAKDEKGAEEVWRQGMVADPKHMAGRFALGRVLVKQGRLSEARELWESRTSDEDRTFPNFIDLLKRAENLKRATDALVKSPNDPDTLIEMGFAVMEGESWVVDRRQERAIVYFKQAAKLKPGSARAQYGICKAYIQIADTFSKEKKRLDEEMAKLWKLDPKLAGELEQYRKTYQGGLIASPVTNDQ